MHFHKGSRHYWVHFSQLALLTTCGNEYMHYYVYFQLFLMNCFHQCYLFWPVFKWFNVFVCWSHSSCKWMVLGTLSLIHVSLKDIHLPYLSVVYDIKSSWEESARLAVFLSVLNFRPSDWKRVGFVLHILILITFSRTCWVLFRNKWKCKLWHYKWITSYGT